MKQMPSGRWTIWLAAVVAAACAGGDAPAPATVAEVKATAKPSGTVMDDDRGRKERDQALAAARVWSSPPVPIGQANLRENPQGPGEFHADQEIICRFTTQEVGGTTPKFYCELPGGEIVKVKYGSANPELRAEAAATRLLIALGFGADRVYVVRRVRCAGCPLFPFQSLKCLQKTRMKSACFAGGINYERVVNFDAAVIERKVEGRRIEGHAGQGWAWFELDKVDPARGGSSAAEVDALRLMAVLLAHWDNKAENQRLVCPPDADSADGTCSRSLAIMQDLGATFGPVKVDLHNWQTYRIWADGATCRVSMKSLPFGGATFPDRQISDAGRLLLLGWLDQLSDQQLRDLFEGSRMTQFDQVSAAARNADAWVRVFKDKVKQIRDGGPCPTASE
jgi:hypothetical protein